MQEDLVTYDIALKLNEKGFVVPCLHYFSLDKEPKQFFEDGNWFFSNGNGGRLILRPTIYQVSKWLREQYELLIIIEPYPMLKGDKTVETIDYFRPKAKRLNFLSKKYKISGIHSRKEFPTYEKAMMHMIEECLKYI